MECNGKYVQRVSHKYNRRHVIGFIQKTAEKRFLSPLGLTLKSFPPTNFGNNCNRLSHSEEIELFEALHYMKYKVSKTNINRCKERYLQIYLALRNRGISANWPLVLSCVKRHVERLSNKIDRAQLIERGYTCLINCVDGFDPWMGYRFSTYACNAIVRSFFSKMKALPAVVSIDEVEDVGSESDEQCELWVERLGILLKSSDLKFLFSVREREVLKHRFYDGLTLKESGDILGISKERIRQIQKEVTTRVRVILQGDPILM